MTHTESIDLDYGREEMVIRYGSKYIAAAMELYEASKEQMTIQYIKTFPAYTYGGDGAPKKRCCILCVGCKATDARILNFAKNLLTNAVYLCRLQLRSLHG